MCMRDPRSGVNLPDSSTYLHVGRHVEPLGDAHMHALAYRHRLFVEHRAPLARGFRLIRLHTPQSDEPSAAAALLGH